MYIKSVLEIAGEVDFDYAAYESNYREYGSGVVPLEYQEYNEEVQIEHTMIAVSWDSCCSKVPHHIHFFSYLSIIRIHY